MTYTEIAAFPRLAAAGRAWLAALLVAAVCLPATASAQPAPLASGPASAPLTLTIDEAIQIALVHNYTVRSLRLDVENAEAQVREAWGQVLPQVNATSSYTRNLKSANPFAGSDAGGLFGSLGFIDWLAFNERARTDENPGTDPISFGEFQERKQAGLDAAGIVLNTGANPFAVPNEFINGISVEQTLFNGSAFAAIAGARRLQEIHQRGADRQEQLLIDQVRQAYYQALLAEEQARVSALSMARTQETLNDVTKQVAQGVTPKFQRLSAEVQLANLETAYVQAQNQAALALDNLKMTLGIPVDQPVQLRGELQAGDQAALLTVSVDDAVTLALEHRPDLEQARLAVELRRIDREITRAQYLPRLSAFAGLNYLGRVPDNRTSVFADPMDPFSFTERTNGWFNSAYWNPSVNVGLRLSWTLFNGFQTSARVQQRQIAVEQARLDQEQLLQAVHLEVERALRNLRTARQRIMSQEQNVQRAELNYEYAQARLREGVASPLEEREASEQLDLSRWNYLQAVYDYLAAKSAFETAVGMPLAAPSAFKLTRN